LDLAVTLGDLGRAAIAELLQLGHISLRGLGEIAECERKEVRVGKAHDGLPSRLRERATIDERRVAEVGVPINVVIDRVIDPASILAAITKIQRRDASMLEKGRVVRARPE